MYIYEYIQIFTLNPVIPDSFYKATERNLPFQGEIQLNSFVQWLSAGMNCMSLHLSDKKSSKNMWRWHLRTWSNGEHDWQLDMMILKAFSNLNCSIIPWKREPDYRSLIEFHIYLDECDWGEKGQMDRKPLTVVLGGILACISLLHKGLLLLYGK